MAGTRADPIEIDDDPIMGVKKFVDMVTAYTLKKYRLKGGLGIEIQAFNRDKLNDEDSIFVISSQEHYYILASLNKGERYYIADGLNRYKNSKVYRDAVNRIIRPIENLTIIEFSHYLTGEHCVVSAACIVIDFIKCYRSKDWSYGYVVFRNYFMRELATLLHGSEGNNIKMIYWPGGIKLKKCEHCDFRRSPYRIMVWNGHRLGCRQRVEKRRQILMAKKRCKTVHHRLAPVRTATVSLFASRGSINFVVSEPQTTKHVTFNPPPIIAA